MVLVESVVDADTFGQWIGLQTAASKTCLTKQLSNWTDDAQRLLLLSKRFQRFKDAFARDPTFFGQCHEMFQEIAEIEQKLQHLLQTDSALERESYNEILFFRPLLQPLNFLPFLLTLWATLRVYILPGLSFMIPFLTFLAPYIVLKFAFKVPITFHNYMNMLHSMVSGDFTQPLASGSAPAPLSIAPAQLIKKFGIVIVTIVQGLIQPYWTYKHLKSIDSIVVEHGALVLRFREAYERLQRILDAHGFSFFKCPLPAMGAEREATARAILESAYFKMAFKYIGSLEVIMCLANKKEAQAVRWVRAPRPVYRIQNTFDFQVPTEVRKTVSASLDNQPHALLTGPNKGGKSTVLRALSLSALLAHTYGCALGTATMTPFHTMYVCLKPDDLPGSKSRFEREMEFTASTLRQDKPILLFIDELYHSTNPPDALRSCTMYCDKLWKKSNIVSVISTHLFELVESAPTIIQRLCCPAVVDEQGQIHFKYDLTQGICKVSSVDELIKRYFHY
jgi:hypothetical protein